MVKNVSFWVICVFAIITTAFTIFSASLSKEQYRYFLGYKVMIVTSDSMKATHFKAGDVIISKRINADQIQEGDVITFVSQSIESYGKTVTHKVKTVTKDVNGKIAFETFGTTTGVSDSALATNVLGKYVGKIPSVGNFFIYLKTPTGYLLLVFIPISTIIIFQLVSCIKALKESEKQ